MKGGRAMATGERIRFFRNLRGMTQKYLGLLLGFSEKTADIRVAQYETDVRKPKEDLIRTLAYAFDIAPEALTVPNIDSHIGMLHTFFAIEDRYGIEAREVNGEIHLCFNKNNPASKYFYKFVASWAIEAEKYRNGEITKEEYDKWRYNFPKYDTYQKWIEILPSKEVNDLIMKEVRKSRRKFFKK